MSTPTPLLAALALAAVLLPAAATHAGHGGQAPSPTSSATLPLRAEAATVVAVPPGATETSVFMTLRNPGNTPVTLTGARTALARQTMWMNTRRDAQGRTGMTNAPGLTVPARGALTLSASGDHLMLMDLTRPLKVGERVRLTLLDARGRGLNVDAVVRKP